MFENFHGEGKGEATGTKRIDLECEDVPACGNITLAGPLISTFT
jgi:hypothetical protein